MQAAYLEATQALFAKRLSLRAGARYTHSKQTSVPTQGVANAVENSETFDYATYSTGFNYILTPQWNLRAGHATGFRTPTATEYAADFELVLGGQVLGNPDLGPEKSQQLEVGAHYTHSTTQFDVALFTTRIEDRITSQVIGSGSGGSISRYANSTDDAELTGMDADASLNIGDYLGWQRYRLTTNIAGTYHFTMRDKGATTLNTDKLQRVYKYQLSSNFEIGDGDAWSVGLRGILRGPIWYETEERLLIPQAEPDSTWVHEKRPFWVWNLKGTYNVDRFRFYGGVENLFNKDEHALFIALNSEPYISNPSSSNGGRGNSMPGRNYYVGTTLFFD